MSEAQVNLLHTDDVWKSPEFLENLFFGGSIHVDHAQRPVRASAELEPSYIDIVSPRSGANISYHPRPVDIGKFTALMTTLSTRYAAI